MPHPAASRIALALASALLLHGCSTEPVALVSTRATDAPVVTKSRAAERQRRKAARAGVPEASCSIAFGTIEDKRTGDKGFGMVAGRPVTVPDAAAWLRDSMRDSLQLPVVEAPLPDTVVIDVTILQGYLQSIYTSMSANVALRVRFSRTGVAPREQVLRGTYTRMNWNSGTDEIRAAMHGAVADVTSKMRSEIDTTCRAVAGV